MNLARVPGQIVLGHVSDHLGSRILTLGLALVSVVTVLTGWGLAKDTTGIIGFSIAFGGFAGSYTALFPRLVSFFSLGETDNRFIATIDRTLLFKHL